MKKQILDRTDLELSKICYGTGNFGDRLTESEAFAILDAYVDAGGNFIDTANVYCRWIPGLGNSSEQYLGAWLKERQAYHKVSVATKGGHYDLDRPEQPRISKEEIARDLEESLRTLGLDCVDFYWLHRDDEQIGISEIIDFMEDFVRQGKIRYYGASNYSQARMSAALGYAKKQQIQGFSAVSNQWSMAEVNPGCNMNPDPSLILTGRAYERWHRETGMPLIPYSSGAHGFFQKLYDKQELSEAMKRAYLNEQNADKFKWLCEQSRERGVSVHTLSIAWLLNQPFTVFPVVSVSSAGQLKDLIRASEITDITTDITSAGEIR